MKRKLLHAAAASIVTAASAIVLATATPAPAHAIPTICDPGMTWLTTTRTSTNVITHLHGYQVPPGGSTTVTKSATFEVKLTASASVTAGTTVSAGAIISKADVNISGTLAASGSATSTKTQTVQSTLPGSTKDRYYAAWAGRVKWSGHWYKYQCLSNGQGTKILGYGTWKSFKTTPLEGIALCPASRYASGSLPYKACKGTWG